MIAAIETAVEDELRDRRDRITQTIREVGEAEDLLRLLTDVDSALDRFGAGTLGRCEVCGDPCDDDDLLAHPSLPYCLCRLTTEQLSALERDLDMAWRVQAALLPPQGMTLAGWETHFRYLPAGPVGGDYCDVLTRDGDDEAMYFLLGDVSGKGVAASFVMAQLNALMRTLVETGADVAHLAERANRHLLESALSSQFATLVCGRADRTGEVEICNAGHCRPIVVRAAATETLDSTGYPAGLVAGAVYETMRVRLEPGDSLVLYSDGVTEAPNAGRRRYGVDALSVALAATRAATPSRMADACLRDLESFQDGVPRADDATLMVIRRT